MTSDISRTQAKRQRFAPARAPHSVSKKRLAAAGAASFIPGSLVACNTQYLKTLDLDLKKGCWLNPNEYLVGEGEDSGKPFAIFAIKPDRCAPGEYYFDCYCGPHRVDKSNINCKDSANCDVRKAVIPIEALTDPAAGQRKTDAEVLALLRPLLQRGPNEPPHVWATEEEVLAKSQKINQLLRQQKLQKSTPASQNQNGQQGPANQQVSNNPVVQPNSTSDGSNLANNQQKSAPVSQNQNGQQDPANQQVSNNPEVQPNSTSDDTNLANKQQTSTPVSPKQEAPASPKQEDPKVPFKPQDSHKVVKLDGGTLSPSGNRSQHLSSKAASSSGKVVRSCCSRLIDWFKKPLRCMF